MTMTYTLSIAEAASQLSELVHRLHTGDSVVLVENNVPVADILPRTKAMQQLPYTPTKEARSEAAEAFLRLFAEAQSMPGAKEITDEVIRAEIDAYRRGE